MARHGNTKLYLCAVLMEMCETAKLSDITLSQVIEKSGLARQTFYNHFADLDDLVCYAASRPVLTGKHAIYEKENVLAAYRYCTFHKAFFCQLPYQEGKNSFREACARWLRQMSYDLFLTAELSPQERDWRKVCIDLYFEGSIAVMMDWFARGMDTPIETIVDASFSMAPPFIRDVSPSTPKMVSSYP